MDAVFSFHSPESIAPVICAKSDKHGTMLDSLKLDMIFITQNNNCNAIYSNVKYFVAQEELNCNHICDLNLI